MLDFDVWCKYHAAGRLEKAGDETLHRVMRRSYELYTETRGLEVHARISNNSAFEVIRTWVLELYRNGIKLHSVSDAKAIFDKYRERLNDIDGVHSYSVSEDTHYLKFTCELDNVEVTITMSTDTVLLEVSGIEEILVDMFKLLQNAGDITFDLYDIANVLSLVKVNSCRAAELFKGAGVDIKKLSHKYFTQKTLQAMCLHFNTIEDLSDVTYLSFKGITKVLSTFLSGLLPVDADGITDFERELLCDNVGVITGLRALIKYDLIDAEPEEEICIWTAYADLHDFTLGKLKLWFNPFIAGAKISGKMLTYNSKENTLLETMYFDNYFSHGTVLAAVVKYIEDTCVDCEELSDSMALLKNVVNAMSAASDSII